MRRIIEVAAICVVSVLLVIFLIIYFSVTKRRKKLAAASKTKKPDDAQTDAIDSDITEEWAEQLQIINAQLDLVFELSPVFTVCCDYGRDCFSVSENGQIQLGFKSERQIDQKTFEDLIHPDDVFIYEEITGAENIRRYDISKSPYVLRLKKPDCSDYGKYLARIKPAYDENGITTALIIAFINVEYLEDKQI